MISVCVPITNREKTIKKCLDSIRTQSFRPQQVIITEFGSFDNSRSIIKDYIYKYSLEKTWSFYWRDEEPIGAEDWNFPLKYVENNYVAILEGDDEWPRDYIKNTTEVIESNPSVKLIFSGFENGKTLQDVDSKIVKNSDAIRQFSKLKWMSAPSQTVFKFDINEVGLFKTNKYLYAPEMQYWTELTMEDGCVVFLSENIVFRRISDVSKFSPLYFNDHFVFINWMREEGIISTFEARINKFNLFCYNLCRFFVRAVTKKNIGNGTFLALFKNLLR